MIHTCRPFVAISEGGIHRTPPIAMPAAMIFAEVLAALDAPLTEGGSSSASPPRGAGLRLLKSDGMVVIPSVLDVDRRHLALGTLTSASPGTLDRAMTVCQEFLPILTKIMRITLERANDRGPTGLMSYHFHSEDAMRSLVEETNLSSGSRDLGAARHASVGAGVEAAKPLSLHHHIRAAERHVVPAARNCRRPEHTSCQWHTLRGRLRQTPRALTRASPRIRRD